MLLDLHVRDLAVIEAATVEFERGLNVLTGETGAGKSIVVDALALLRGARASADLIRTGAERLVVSGRFEATADVTRTLEAVGVDAEGEALVVRREIGREGRNRAFVNDQPATVRLLREVTAPLLRIHAQREELALATAETQRAMIDGRGGAAALPLLAEVADRHATYRSLAERLERVKGDRRAQEERVDLLRFQTTEIDAARLEVDEDLELRAERERLRHAEQIGAALGQGHLDLAEDDGAAVERLARTETALKKIVDWEPAAADWLAELEELRVRAEEVARAMRANLDAVAADPSRLNQIEERLLEIDRLRRKYGDSVADVLDHRAAAASELESLTGDLEDSAELEAEVAAALEAYREAAVRLSAERRRWADDLIAAAEAELADLGLAKARLTVDVGRRSEADSPLVIDGTPIAFGATGIDSFEMRLAANPGEAPRPLATSASGGELSRIFLGLRLAARTDVDGRTTMVFDEADAGLGGEAASALGRKLRRLAADGQVLAVTHLAQVASFADAHFGIRKAVSAGRTRTAVERLTDEDRVEEIARMLAGDQQSDASRTHAEAMIASAGGDRSR